ncbi:MAG TPA: LysR family transcriptional regulator [Polyangiaceae bacterium]|nr:LysR family transcriptional regulator [Polyangiaceae bacterium]
MHELKLSGLDLNLLVVLRALLSERHVTRAAQQLGLSQSAASHALSRLRELYADPLLVRSGRELVPTPRALALLPQLERGLNELAASVQGPAPFEPKLARAQFRIVVDDYTQALVLPRLLNILQHEAPGLDVKAVAHPNPVEEVESGNFDLATSPKRAYPSSFSQRLLGRDSFMCMLRKGHPLLAGGKSLTLKRYLELGHLLVAPGGTSGSIVDTELEKRGLSRRVVLTVSSFLVAPFVIAESDLISTAPARLLRLLSLNFPIVLCKPPLALAGFDHCLIWHSRRDHDPAHRWLRDAFVRAAHGTYTGAARA